MNRADIKDMIMPRQSERQLMLQMQERLQSPDGQTAQETG